MHLKAIETHYKGYRFRSRLEARWAVLFDTLDLDWAYEPEGFELQHGRYLPDFRVWFDSGRKERDGFWAEIKGRDPEPGEMTLAEDLHWATRRPVVIFSGDIQCFRAPGPEYFEQKVTRLECCDPGANTAYYHNKYVDKNEQHFYTLPCWAAASGLGLAVMSWNTMHYGPDWDQLGKYKSFLWLRGNLLAAVRAARSARFEHGESGAPAWGGDMISPTQPR